MDTEKLIGALLYHFKFNDEDFTYFDFDLKTGFDKGEADQVDELELNGEKHEVFTIQKGCADHGFHGEVAVCLHGDADFWFIAQWCE